MWVIVCNRFYEELEGRVEPERGTWESFFCIYIIDIGKGNCMRRDQMFPDFSERSIEEALDPKVERKKKANKEELSQATCG